MGTHRSSFLRDRVRTRRPRPFHPERGMVTAELAIGIIGLVLLLGAACWSVMVVGLQTRCQDTAAEMARQYARADDAAAEQARQRGPKGSRASVHRSGATVSVDVEMDSAFGTFGRVHLHGRATAAVEPGVQR